MAGVAKSGTTALYKQLVKHPDIESPAIKEPYFWTYPQRRKIWKLHKHVFIFFNRLHWFFVVIIAMSFTGNFVGYLNLMTNDKRNIYRKSSDGYHNKITCKCNLYHYAHHCG